MGGALQNLGKRSEFTPHAGFNQRLTFSLRIVPLSGPPTTSWTSSCYRGSMSRLGFGKMPAPASIMLRADTPQRARAGCRSPVSCSAFSSWRRRRSDGSAITTLPLRWKPEDGRHRGDRCYHRSSSLPLCRIDLDQRSLRVQPFLDCLLRECDPVCDDSQCFGRQYCCLIFGE